MDRYFMFIDRKTQYFKISVLNLIYRLNAISIKVPENYFVDIEKLILMLI